VYYNYSLEEPRLRRCESSDGKQKVSLKRAITSNLFPKMDLLCNSPKTEKTGNKFLLKIPNFINFKALRRSQSSCLHKMTDADPSLERTFRGHRSYVSSLSFSPTLKQLASASGDNCIMLWNFKPALRAFRFIGHKVRKNSTPALKFFAFPL